MIVDKDGKPFPKPPVVYEWEVYDDQDRRDRYVMQAGAMKPKGRPPLAKDGEKMRNRNFRATDAEWARCLKLGGGAFLRAKIKAAKVGHNVKLRG